MVQANRLFEAAAALITLLPPKEMGQALYESNCAPFHVSDDSGGLAPAVRPSSFVQSRNDQERVDFLVTDCDGTAMDGLEEILTEDELTNLVLFLRAWQE